MAMPAAMTLAEGIVGRVSHGISHLPRSQRYHLAPRAPAKAPNPRLQDSARRRAVLPVSREQRTVLIRRMDAVAAVYQITSLMSPGIDGPRSHVEFHHGERSDATIALHDGRTFGAVRSGPDPAATVSLRSAESRSGVRRDASS